MKHRVIYKKRLLGSQVLTKKTVSKVVLKQYKKSLSIERRRRSGKRKGFTNQKESKIIRIFSKTP